MKKNSSNRGALWGLFFISPFLTLLFIIKNLSVKNIKPILIGIGVFYSLVFVPIPGSDAVRIQTVVESHQNYSIQEYVSDLAGMFEVNPEFKDPYYPTCVFITSSLGGGITMFRVIIGFVYFYFLVSLLLSIYSDFSLSENKSWIITCFYVFLVFIIPLSGGLTGVRWPTALIILLYSSYKLATTNQRKYFILACLATLVHFAIVPSLLAIALISFMPWMRNYYFTVIVLLLSIVFAETLANMFMNYSDVTETLEQSTRDYTGEGYVNKRQRGIEKWNWHVSIGKQWPFQLCVLASIVISIMRNKLEFNKLTEKIFPLSVYFTVFALITGGILDFSTNRFGKLSEFFMLLLLLGIWQSNSNKKIVKVLVGVFLFVYTFKMYITLNSDIQTIGLLFFSNPLIAFVYSFFFQN